MPNDKELDQTWKQSRSRFIVSAGFDVIKGATDSRTGQPALLKRGKTDKEGSTVCLFGFWLKKIVRDLDDLVCVGGKKRGAGCS